MNGPKSTVFQFCLLTPMDLIKRNQVDKHTSSPLPQLHTHSPTFRAAHLWWRTGKQPNSQTYQTAKACPLQYSKISFPTQNPASAFYWHFWRGTTCQKSRTKARQRKFPNFPYELHWTESCLWTDCFLVLDLILEFSFFLFIPLSSLTKWQGLPCHLS